MLSPTTLSQMTLVKTTGYEFEVATLFYGGAYISQSGTVGLFLSSTNTSASTSGITLNNSIGSSAGSQINYTVPATLINTVSANVTYYFESNIANANAAGTTYAGLWDVTSGSLVANSTVSLAGTAEGPVRSSVLTLTAGHKYQPVVWSSNGNYAGYLSTARIVGQV